jgi:amidase
MQTTRRAFLKQTGALAVGTSAGLSLLRCGSSFEPAVTDLTSFDGVGLAELVRRRQVTPLELVEDVIRRVEEVNGPINAVLTSLFDADKARIRTQGELGDGPLAGVPVMLKNLIEYEEAAIDSGSRLMALARERGISRPGTSPLVTAMENSGMIVTGITNTPEMGLIDTTEPRLHGPTRNPWNTDYTAGGSSGGTAAAVAAGIVPLAHGNDGGGSIRLPASQCGVFGLKPTRARELGSRGSGLLDISNNLCLSRSVRDTAAFLSVVENPNLADFPPVRYVRGPSTKRLRMALMMEGFQGVAVHPEVEKGVLSAADLCRELGHEVVEVQLPIDGAEFIDTFIGFWASGTVATEALVAEWLGEGTDPSEVLEPWTLGLIQMAKDRGPEACVERAIEVFTRANQAMSDLFQRHDVLLSPVLREPPYPIGHHWPMGDFETILERVIDSVAYTPLQNAVGMPGMSVPLHWTADNLPVGVQFSAWRGGDRTLLELAYELEEARPWADRRPPIYASPANIS